MTLGAPAVERVAPKVVVGSEEQVTAEFIPGLRRIADETGALRVFDVVMTGFRIAYRGARERFDLTPDLTALGKVTGGGLPVAAALAGRD